MTSNSKFLNKSSKAVQDNKQETLKKENIHHEKENMQEKTKKSAPFSVSIDEKKLENENLNELVSNYLPDDKRKNGRKRTQEKMTPSK